MTAQPSDAQWDFFDAHSGIDREDVDAHAEESARVNEARLADEMRDLAEHPLDLTGGPYADMVLAELPEGLHPLVARDFWTLPREHFVIEGRPVSVREWLLRGGDLAPALLYAESYFVLG